MKRAFARARSNPPMIIGSSRRIACMASFGGLHSPPDWSTDTSDSTATSMIHVIATIHLNPGTRKAFLEEFHRLMPQVHAEAGCIEYGPTIDVATNFANPTPFREDVAVIVEKWSDLNALQAHSVAPHMDVYRARVKDFVKSVELQVLEPA